MHSSETHICWTLIIRLLETPIEGIIEGFLVRRYQVHITSRRRVGIHGEFSSGKRTVCLGTAGSGTYLGRMMMFHKKKKCVMKCTHFAYQVIAF